MIVLVSNITQQKKPSYADVLELGVKNPVNKIINDPLHSQIKIQGPIISCLSRVYNTVVTGTSTT